MGLLTGNIIAISVSTERGVRKNNVRRARLIADWGIEGDAHAGPGNRQVSLLAVESIEKIRALGLDVKPGNFAENITTVGLDLLALPIGARLSVGDCDLEITQIGKECHSHCEIYAQVGDCVMPREGIFARVVRGGEMANGDTIVVKAERVSA